MYLFYAPDIESGELPSEEAQHAARVLRLKTGDTIQLMDGKGITAIATVTEIDKRNCLYHIESKELFENPVEHLHIAVAPTKSTDRLEWMIEKMVEIGIGTIHLITTERTERSKINLERLQKKVIAASKQSHKKYLTEVSVYKSLKSFIEKSNFNKKAIAHLIETERTYLGSILDHDSTSCVLIGPEGDFTDKELKLAISSGYKSVTLGDFRLRTETAAVFASTILNNSRYI